MPFSLDGFVNDVRTAAGSDQAVREVNRLLTAAVADPAAVAAAVPEYEGDELLLHEDDAVSIYCVQFYSDRIVPPHDHKMPAFIGVYAGVEVNELYRHDQSSGLSLVKEQSVAPGQTLSIGSQGIHGVRTGDRGEDSFALHVYLGRLRGTERNLYDPDSGKALPFSLERFDALIRSR